MLYKEFIAETAQKIMGQVVSYQIADRQTLTAVELKRYTRNCIEAAKALADALEEDYKMQPVDGGIKRCAEKDTFFDNQMETLAKQMIGKRQMKEG